MKWLWLIFGLLFLLCGCEKKVINNESGNVIQKTEKVEISKEKSIIDSSEDDDVVKNQTKEENSKIEEKNVASYSKNDNIVIEQIEIIEKDVDSLLIDDNTETVGDKAKGIFISLVDFVFYGGVINGVTFDELTDLGKEKVLSLVNNIDNKIEGKFPYYKENISDKVGSFYTKASEVIKKGANNINDFTKEKLGDEYYNQMIAAKDELVKYTKNAFSIIGNIGSNLWDNATGAISEWYKKFKNGN